MTGFRGRLLATVVGLVALTSIVLGSAAFLFVATSLREQSLADATARTGFNVAVLAEEVLPADVAPDDPAIGAYLRAIEQRGESGAVIDFGDGERIASNITSDGVLARVSDELTTIVADGRIGFERLTLRPPGAAADASYLVTGARRPPNGPDFYFVFDTTETEAAISQLGLALLVGGLVLTGLAVLAGGAVTRGVLRPVRDAGEAAERIAGGDLSARLDTTSRDEFGTWAASFNHMAESLDRTVAALRAAQDRQRAFVADVSHELRTPVTALVQEAELLRTHLDSLPPDGRRAAELLVGDVARLRALVDDLMEVSRFDADAEVAEPTEVDIAAFVRAVVAARLPAASVDLAEAPARVVLDRRRLERILGNLLDNARQHAGGSAVEVSVETFADALRVVVADRGPGVAPDQLDRLFERFHKADPSRSRGGSGLGLAIAREHTELLGGTLRAELRAAGGMQFVLDLPVTRPLPGGDEPVTGASDG